MKPMNQTPKQECVVEHFDSPLRFHVRSRSETGQSYLVDLGSDKYRYGECHCQHFLKVVGPAQLRGERRECYHLARARDAFTDWAIQAFKAQDKNDPDDA
jgi:hypothetical protein